MKRRAQPLFALAQHNVMLDLETLATAKNAAVVAVGAVYFNAKGLGETFYQRVNLQSCVDAGLVIDAATVLWWMNKSDAARAELLKHAAPLASVLDVLTAYLRQWPREELTLWGNGVSSDNVWLDSAYRAVGKNPPWSFWSDRCYRTVKNLAPNIRLVRTGTHHNALDDAKSQARHLLNIMRRTSK